MSQRKVPKGFQRRLYTADFLHIGKWHLARVALGLHEAVYDGEARPEGSWWAVRFGDGAYVLCDSLKEALDYFEMLEEAVARAPTAFAEVVAVENGFSRVGVVGPGRPAEELVRRQGITCEPPSFSAGVLTFQLYQPLDLYRRSKQRVYSVCARLTGKIISKDLLTAF